MHPVNFFLASSVISSLLSFLRFYTSIVISGVSYLSRSQEEEALERISSTFMDESSDSVYGLREDAEFPLVRMADVLFAERMKNTIREWHASLLSKGSSSSEIKQMSTDPNQRFQMVFFKTRPALALSGFTSRQLRVIKSVTSSSLPFHSFLFVLGSTYDVRL